MIYWLLAFFSALLSAPSSSRHKANMSEERTPCTATTCEAPPEERIWTISVQGKDWRPRQYKMFCKPCATSYAKTVAYNMNTVAGVVLHPDCEEEE